MPGTDVNVALRLAGGHKLAAAIACCDRRTHYRAQSIPSACCALSRAYNAVTRTQPGLPRMLLLSALLATALCVSAKHLQLGFEVYHGTDRDHVLYGRPLVVKRDGGVTVSLTNEQLYYLVNFTLGSNNQSVGALIDTGSLDLWVISSLNSLCSTSPDAVQGASADNCGVTGTFNPSTLDSYKTSDAQFYIQYLDSSFASGYWGEDTLGLGGITVENYFFAVADQSNSSSNVLGIALEPLELSVEGTNTQAGFTYSNLPMRLYQDKIIDWPLYLLWLNEYDATTGSILFGAIDYAKFTGDLNVVPLVPSIPNYDFVDLFAITLKGVSTLSSSDELLGASVSAIFDLGTTLTYLPWQTVDRLAKELKLSWVADQGAYVGLCNQDMSGNITFGFDGFDFSVPISNYWLELGTDASNNLLCALTILPAVEAGNVLFGDNTLQNMYVVYDLKNLELGIASAVVDTDKSDVRTALGLPHASSATYVASASQTYAMMTAVPDASEVASEVAGSYLAQWNTLFALYSGQYFTDAKMLTGLIDETAVVSGGALGVKTDHTSTKGGSKTAGTATATSARTATAATGSSASTSSHKAGAGVLLPSFGGLAAVIAMILL